MMLRLTSYRLFHGTLAHTAAFVAGQVVLPVLLVPVMVGALGEAGYGKWAVMITLGGWLLFLDLGLHRSIPKFAGECAAAGDAGRFTQLAAGAAVFGFVCSLFAAAVTWAAAPWILRMFVGEPAAGDVAALRLVFLFHIVTVIWRGARGFLDGAQKISEASRLALGISVIQFAALIGILWTRPSLAGVAAVFLAFNIAQAIGFIRMVRAIRIGPDAPGPAAASLFHSGLLRQMLDFGLILYFVHLLGNVVMSDRLYLGWAGVSLETITHYHLAAVLIGKPAALMATFSVAIYPAAAALMATENRPHLGTLTLRGYKFHVIAGTLMFPFIACFAPDIFHVWIGRPMPEAAQFTLLLLPWGMTSVIGSLTAVGAGMGKPGYQLKSSVLVLAFAAALFPVLVLPRGAAGLALTVSISVAAVAVIYLFDFKRKILQVGGRELFWEATLKPLLGAAALALPWALDRILDQWIPDPGRITAAAELALLFGVYAALYAAYALACGVIDREDRDRIASWFRTSGRRGV